MGVNFDQAITDIETAASARDTLADGMPVLITELTGDTITLLLDGTDLPERGIEVAGDLRSQATWYPGASAASTQIMGTSEADITLQGHWRDVWAGIDGWAAFQVESARGMWLRQSYCELSWGSLLVRRGYIKRVVVRIDTERDIAYEIVFQVVEADEADVVTSDSAAIELTTSFELSDLLDLLGDAMDLVNSAAAYSNAAQAIL